MLYLLKYQPNNTNITVNIEQTTATAYARQLNIILAYDALIEINMVNKQASLKFYASFYINSKLS